jgi:hypothetical protein
MEANKAAVTRPIQTRTRPASFAARWRALKNRRGVPTPVATERVRKLLKIEGIASRCCAKEFATA